MARRFSQRKEISYEETLAPGSKIHFLHNYHGTHIHDEVGLTPNGCKDDLPKWCDKEEVYIERPQGFDIEDR